MKWFRQVGVLVRKDLRVEFRSGELLFTMVFFATMIVLMFAFAFLQEGKDNQMVQPAEVSPGFLLIAITFAGTLGLSRAFDREREGDTMRALLLAPVPRSAIILGKAISISIFIVVVEAVMVPLVALFFEFPLLKNPVALIGVLLLAAVGFATTGSVFAALLLRAKSRDVLLPVALYPLLIPLLIASVKSIAAIIEGGIELGFWMRFLLFYDVVFAALSLWVFESLVIE